MTDTLADTETTATTDTDAPTDRDRTFAALTAAIALALFGKHLDIHTPIGMKVLTTVGYELAAPLARMVQDYPGLEFAVDETVNGPATVVET